MIDLEETLEKSADVAGDILCHVCNIPGSAKQGGLKHAYSKQQGLWQTDHSIVFINSRKLFPKKLT
jgi:hypothetical protein